MYKREAKEDRSVYINMRDWQSYIKIVDRS